MDVNIENSGKESNNDSVLNLDLNPDGEFILSCLSCNIAHLQEKKKSLLRRNLVSDVRRNIYMLTSWKVWVVLLWQLSRDANRKQGYKLSRNECTRWSTKKIALGGALVHFLKADVKWTVISNLFITSDLNGTVVDIVIIKADLKEMVIHIICYGYVSIFFQVNQEFQKPKWLIRWIFDQGQRKWLCAKGLRLGK